MRQCWRPAAGGVLVAVLWACGGGATNPLGSSSPSAPMIVNITSEPASVPHGESAVVTVSASGDGPFSYEYAAEAGRVVGNGSIVTYMAPRAGMVDRVRVTVTGPGGSTASTLGLGLNGHAPPTDTPFPDSPGTVPTPTPPPQPSPKPPASPEPPPPSPAPPTPPPPGPTPPTVQLTGGGSCHPECGVGFNANATGSGLSYSWGGCCSGSGASTTCRVNSVGDHTCTVTVSNAGGSASDSGTATGVNDDPTLALERNSYIVNPGEENYVTWSVDDDDPASSGSCTASGGGGATRVTCSVSPPRLKFKAPSCSDCAASATIVFTDRWGAKAPARTLTILTR